MPYMRGEGGGPLLEAAFRYMLPWRSARAGMQVFGGDCIIIFGPLLEGPDYPASRGIWMSTSS